MLFLGGKMKLIEKRTDQLANVSKKDAIENEYNFIKIPVVFNWGNVFTALHKLKQSTRWQVTFHTY